jgi:hypothetical protein
VTDELRTLADMRERLRAIDLVYFGGELEQRDVELHWIRWRPEVSFVFGRCWPERGRIEVHRALAWRWVPECVVLTTLYHEALHIVIGREHNREFHLAERHFVHLADAVRWEINNMERLTSAPRPPLRRVRASDTNEVAFL